MKTFKAILITGLVFLFVMGGCRSLPPPDRTTETHDTVFIDRTVTITDTFFTTESSQVSIQVPCDPVFQSDFKPIAKQVKNATLSITKQGNSIIADCFCDTISIKAQLANTYEKEYRARSTVSEKVPAPKSMPWYFKFLIWSGAISWFLFIIYLTLKIKP